MIVRIWNVVVFINWGIVEIVCCNSPKKFKILVQSLADFQNICTQLILKFFEVNIRGDNLKIDFYPSSLTVQTKQCSKHYWNKMEILKWENKFNLLHFEHHEKKSDRQQHPDFLMKDLMKVNNICSWKYFRLANFRLAHQKSQKFWRSR